MDEGNKGGNPVRRPLGRSLGGLAGRWWPAVTVLFPSETNSEWASDAIVVESVRAPKGLRFRCNVHIPEGGREGLRFRMASKRNDDIGYAHVNVQDPDDRMLFIIREYIYLKVAEGNDGVRDEASLPSVSHVSKHDRAYGRRGQDRTGGRRWHCCWLGICRRRE